MPSFQLRIVLPAANGDSSIKHKQSVDPTNHWWCTLAAGFYFIELFRYFMVYHGVFLLPDIFFLHNKWYNFLRWFDIVTSIHSTLLLGYLNGLQIFPDWIFVALSIVFFKRNRKKTYKKGEYDIVRRDIIQKKS